MKTIEWYIIRWFVQWVALIDAICGIITLGCWSGSMVLWAESKFLDISEDQSWEKIKQ